MGMSTWDMLSFRYVLGTQVAMLDTQLYLEFKRKVYAGYTNMRVIACRCRDSPLLTMLQFMIFRFCDDVKEIFIQ